MVTRSVKRAAGLAAMLLGLQVLVGLTPAKASGGDELWASRFSSPKGLRDIAEAIAVSPDGSRVFVMGATDYDSPGSDWATVAYDAATGGELWSRRFAGPPRGDGLDYPYALAVSPEGTRVFVTGTSYSPQTEFDYETIAYDAETGTTLWSRRYDNAGGTDAAAALTVSPDGTRVFVTGQTSGDYATVAYDAATGATIWGTRYEDPEGSGRTHSIAMSPDGFRVFVTGDSGADYVTVAYGASRGTELWVARYTGPDGSQVAESVAVSPDGARVFVTGYGKGGGSKNDYVTLAYDAATGAFLWGKRYDGPATQNDYAYAVGVSPDGSQIFVTGVSKDPGTGKDYATVSYDAANGNELWVSRYYGMLGDRRDEARSLVVSPDGAKVIVTGSSPGIGTATDYATVAYDTATGSELWVGRYDGPPSGGDNATAIAVTPDGTRVFVTGLSVSSRTDHDFATVAYEA